MHGADMDMDNMVTESLGTLLKQTRRSQQKSIKDAAAATCIHVHTLRALEADDYSVMRAEIFVRGFIKIYAVYLGISPEEALDVYEKSGLRPPGHEPHQLLDDEGDIEDDEKSPLLSNRLLLGAVLVILAIIFFTGRNILFNKDSNPDNTLPPPIPLTTLNKPKIAVPAPVVAKIKIPPTTTPAETHVDRKTPTAAPVVMNKPETVAVKKPKPAEPSRKKALPPPIRYTVVARFIESTWMKIIIDNGPARQYTYHPGETRTWKARKKMRMFIGNAGGIRVTVNGEAMPPLGPSGEVARLSIPRGLAKLREKKIPRTEPTAIKTAADSAPASLIVAPSPLPALAPITRTVPPAGETAATSGETTTVPETETGPITAPAAEETVQPEYDSQ